MWIFYALTTSVIVAVNSVIWRKLSAKTHYLILATGQATLLVPLLVLAGVLWYRVGSLGSLFWVGVFGSGILNVVANVWIFRAISLENVSTLAPLAAFNPLCMLLISMVTLHETPSFSGLLGISSISIGVFLLTRQSQEVFHRSIVRFFQRPGVQLAMGANFLWAITPTFEKPALLAMQPPNPAIFSAAINAVIVLGTWFIARRTVAHLGRQLVSRWPLWILVGVLTTVGQLAALTAFLMTHVSYAAAIFRTSMFFTIVLASIFLKERVSKEQAGAAMFMFVGAVLLAW